MEINNPTLLDRVVNMTDQQLHELAEGESLAIASSSKLEGLVLDQVKIRDELLAGFRVIRNRRRKENV